MFEKFSAGAIQALNASREETLRLEFNQVDTDHLLLGLAHERMGVVARTFERHQIALKHLRLAVEHLSGRGYSMTRMEDLVFAPATLRTLARAAQAHPTLVESHDVFLALLDEQESAALAVVRHLKVEPDSLKALARELASTEAPGVPLEEAVLPSRYSHRLLTARADSVVSYAMAATRFFGHTIVGTEQLLTGLLHVKDGLANQVLTLNGVEVIAVEAVTARLIGRGSGTRVGRLTLSRWTEEVLEQAWTIARRFKHTRVGTGHILLALTELDVGGALAILDHLDINLAQIRYDVEQAFEASPGNPEPDGVGAELSEWEDAGALLEEA